MNVCDYRWKGREREDLFSVNNVHRTPLEKRCSRRRVGEMEVRRWRGMDEGGREG